MKFRYFLLGWFVHSVAATITESVRLHREGVIFKRELRLAGKRLADQIAGYRDAMGAMKHG